MKILVTGSAGFIGGYLVQSLLKKGHTVVGIDNYSKYGRIIKSYDKDKNYIFVKGDVKNTTLLKKLAKDCDHLIACAAKIGGISYFHELSYDLLAENERLIASTFDAAINAYKYNKLKKITVISSSMVFESANIFPTSESDLKLFPPPLSTYGFQKLSTEYFAKGAFEQYRLPYTIVRPFNCIGIGETNALDKSLHTGNIKLATSHVVPDLIQKVLKKQYPLHLLGNGKQIRHFTYGEDLAEGIVLAVFSPKAKNEDFNISTNESTTILELAKLIWKKTNQNKKFKYKSDKQYIYDVQKRIPNTSKAKKMLGFETKTSLSEALDIIIPWIREQIKLKNI